MTQGPSFAGGHETPCPFIQERPEGGKFLLELSEPFHAPESYTLPAGYATFIYLRLLNGNEKIEEQAKWLDGILTDNPQRWTIAAIHQPIFSTAKYRNESTLRNQLLPIFEKHSVDLVLQGHDHTYARSYRIKSSAMTGDDAKGTVYVISVSGPKFYQVETRYEGLMARIEAGRQLFQVIRVDGHRLYYESFDVKGELFDSFTLEK